MVRYHMKRFFGLVVAVIALTSAARADYYVAGDFNGWNATGNLMTESPSGIWQASLTGVAAGNHQFRITDGTNWLYPSSGGNSWLYEDNTGNVTITFDTNSESDGYVPSQYRIGLSSDGQYTSAMYLPGDFNGWSTTGNPMTYEGSGIFDETLTLAAGTYNFKALSFVGDGTGNLSWDSGNWYAYGTTGADLWSGNLSLTSDGSSSLKVIVDMNKGAMDVVVVPEPSTIGLVLVGLLGAVGMIRRRKA